MRASAEHSLPPADRPLGHDLPGQPRQRALQGRPVQAVGSVSCPGTRHKSWDIAVQRRSTTGRPGGPRFVRPSSCPPRLRLSRWTSPPTSRSSRSRRSTARRSASGPGRCPRPARNQSLAEATIPVGGATTVALSPPHRGALPRDRGERPARDRWRGARCSPRATVPLIPPGADAQALQHGRGAAADRVRMRAGLLRRGHGARGVAGPGVPPAGRGQPPSIVTPAPWTSSTSATSRSSPTSTTASRRWPTASSS